MAWAEVYLRTEWHLDPSSRLATTDMGQNWVGAVPFFLVGELGPHLRRSCLGEAYLHTKWHLSPSSRLATRDISQKIGGCVPLGEGELGPHLTQCRLG